jgi:hypothetical protein
VRNKLGTFVGRIWVPVEKLEPGQTATYEVDCYRRQVPGETLELFDLPEPQPEDRESFWEFRVR